MSMIIRVGIWWSGATAIGRYNPCEHINETLSLDLFDRSKRFHT